MQFYEPKEWPVGARSGQLDMTFVAFSIVLLRIGDLHQGHVHQCEAGGKDTTNRDGSAFMQGGWIAVNHSPNLALKPVPAAIWNGWRTGTGHYLKQIQVG